MRAKIEDLERVMDKKKKMCNGADEEKLAFGVGQGTLHYCGS